MNTEKKLCLFVTSLALVLVLLSTAPMIVPVLGNDRAPAMTHDTGFFLSAAPSPPKTTIALGGTLGYENWYISDVPVTLTVLDPALEYTTAYSYDNKTWITYDDPFVVTNEGETKIYYNSTYAGVDPEKTGVLSFKIDKTPPVLTLETEVVPGEGVLVTLTAEDTLSGFRDMGYSLDGKTWPRYAPFLLSDVGLQPVWYKARDIAGNEIIKLDYVEVIILPATSPTEVTYSGDKTGVYSDLVNLEAKLIDVVTGMPIPDKWIVFTLGTQTVSALTDIDGIATSVLVLDQPEGIYDVSASFGGDESYLASSATEEFVVQKEQAFTFYSGLTIVQDKDSTITLIATILDEADGYWGDLTTIYVTFTFYLPSDPTTPLQIIDSIEVSTTDLTGIGIATVEIPNLAEGEYLIVISLNPEQNHYYWSQDSDPTIITVYQPGRESVSGAGWIEDADGNRGHFVFLVKYTCRGGLKGSVFYTLRVDNLVYFVKSTEITGFTIYEDHAFFEASITIYIYNLETRKTTQLEDIYRLRIDVWDYNKRCRKDIFQIQIFDKYGFVVYEAGFDPLGYVHRGSIVIHSYCHHRHHWHYWHHRCYCHRMRHW
jgi:hypothetical protein